MSKLEEQLRSVDWQDWVLNDHSRGDTWWLVRSMARDDIKRYPAHGSQTIESVKRFVTTGVLRGRNYKPHRSPRPSSFVDHRP